MKDNLKFILSFLGVATAYVALVAYGTTTSYYAGYLGQFDVSIKDVNFWPRPYDFMTQAVYALAVLAILTLIMTAMILAINGTLKLIATVGTKKKRLRRLTAWAKLGIMSNSYIFTILAACLIIPSFNVSLVDAYERGVDAAQKQQVFTVIQGTSTKIFSVIIYQSDELAITKDYNKQHGTFSDTYRMVDPTNNYLRTEKIR